MQCKLPFVLLTSLLYLYSTAGLFGHVPVEGVAAGGITSRPAPPESVFRNYVAFAQGRIHGKGPYWFLIDTGASRSALDETVLDSLGLEMAAPTIVEGAAGSISVRTAKVEMLTIGSVTARNLEPTVYDLSGSLAPEGERIAGILGYDVFKDHAILFDPRAGRLAFAQTADDLVDLDRATLLPFNLDNNIPAVSATIDGQAVRLRLDTGASIGPGPVTYVNITQSVFELLQQADPDLVPYTRFTASGAGGAIVLPVARATSLRLGDIEIAEPHLIVQPPVGYFARPDAMGFLGTYTLQRLSRFVVDYPNRRLILFADPEPVEAAAQSAPLPTPGDYAGWIYFDAGPDMPIRLHLRTDGDGALTAALDLPVYDMGGLAASSTSSNEALRIRVPDVSGFDIEFELRWDTEPAGLVGRTTWSSENRTLQGDAYFHRSAVPLPWVSPAEIPDASGVFAIGPSRSIIITRRGWGELFYTDPYSGRSGYLFAQSPTTLFAGRGPYVPTAVTATIELQTNADGHVTALTWQETDHDPVLARRTEFITTPVRFQSGDVEIAGVMTRLDGDCQRPGIVVIGGSDWETAAGMRPFAEVFASFGFAVLSFDKRGHGDSGGDSVASFATIAGDVARAAEVLASRPEVRDGKVGVFGYSRAGWHTPLAASMTEAIGFAVMFVPPAVSPADQESTRRLAELRADGVRDAADLDLARQYLDAMWSFAQTGRGGEEYLRLRERVERRGWLDVLEGPPTLDESEWRWSRLNMHYDPLPALRRMRCPVLAVFGGADSNVTPEQNLPPMRETLREAQNPDATLEVIPDADHGLRLMPPQGASEHIRVHNSRPYAPRLWPMVHAWLAERAILNE